MLSSKIALEVHEPGERILDAVLAIVAASTSGEPRAEVLAIVCERVSKAALADVVSIYVREANGEDDALVMRANVGFPRGALGRVRLRVGEGITGVAAARGRPVSARMALTDPSFKPVPGLGEEEFPVMLAVPMHAEGQVVGVLVLQRRIHAVFEAAEVAMATALAAVVGGIVGSSSRGSASLPGKASGPGSAVGRACSLPTLAGNDIIEAGHADRVHALDRVEREMQSALRRVTSVDASLGDEIADRLWMLADERLRAEIHAQCAEHGLRDGLSRVSRRYAAASYTTDSATGVPWLSRRAREVDHLCLLICSQLSGRNFMPPGGVLVVAEPPTLLLALSLVARRAAGVVVAADVVPSADALVLRVLRAANIALVTGVEGIFHWCRPGDPVLVDGDAGLVRIHPSSGDVVRSRRETARPPR